jgi:hypothetical protein
MVGGARFQNNIYEWTRSTHSVFFTVFTIALLVFAAYPDRLPPSIKWQLSTTVGRLLLLLILYVLLMLAGPIPALLFTVAVALIWATRPLFKPPTTEEGFSPGSALPTEGFRDVKTSTIPFGVKQHRWFIERVLNENPLAVKEDRIDTYPIEDDSQVGSTRSSK